MSKEASKHDEAQPDPIEDLPALEKTEAENTDGVKGGIISTGLQDAPDTLPQLSDPPDPVRTSTYIR